MAFRAARATLLFPRTEHVVRDGVREEIPQERPSERRLDSVGAISVLGAMVEQRRRSQPPPPLDLDLSDPESPDESGPRPVLEKKSIGFIKIR